MAPSVPSTGQPPVRVPYTTRRTPSRGEDSAAVWIAEVRHGTIHRSATAPSEGEAVLTLAQILRDEGLSVELFGAPDLAVPVMARRDFGQRLTDVVHDVWQAGARSHSPTRRAALVGTLASLLFFAGDGFVWIGGLLHADEIFDCVDIKSAGLRWDQPEDANRSRFRTFNSEHYTVRVTSKSARKITRHLQPHAKDSTERVACEGPYSGVVVCKGFYSSWAFKDDRYTRSRIHGAPVDPYIPREHFTNSIHVAHGTCTRREGAA